MWTNVHYFGKSGQKDATCLTLFPLERQKNPLLWAAIAIINLFSKWAVKDADAAIILGGISKKTLRRWRDGDYGRVNRDMADRMSNLLGIHKALRVIFSDPQRGYSWINNPNKAFGDQSALDVLRLGGMEDVVRIRRYLDSVRGGW